ncbi:hypothetical protein BC833DRAFT_561567 [Globomyces pollinis-pini]|nr:hypothetical protein BC833DRAFT_561567 [Globomyces pollinis-pini]
MAIKQSETLENFLSNPYNAIENPLSMVKKRGQPIVEGLSKSNFLGHNARTFNRIGFRIFLFLLQLRKSIILYYMSSRHTQKTSPQIYDFDINMTQIFTNIGEF